MSSTPLCDKGFLAFAPEVREMIFKETLAETWDGKTPTLIQALRGSKLHVEAMNAFTRTNTYVLHGGNGWSWGTMTPKVIKHIKTLQVELADGLENKPLARLFEEAVQAMPQRGGTIRPEILIIKLNDDRHSSMDDLRGRTISAGPFWCSVRFWIVMFQLTTTNRRISTLKIFTQGHPELFTPLWMRQPVEQMDFRYEMRGAFIVDQMNAQFEENAVLGRISSSDTQEWIWHRQGGLTLHNRYRKVWAQSGQAKE